MNVWSKYSKYPLLYPPAVGNIPQASFSMCGWTKPKEHFVKNKPIIWGSTSVWATGLIPCLCQQPPRFPVEIQQNKEDKLNNFLFHFHFICLDGTSQPHLLVWRLWKVARPPFCLSGGIILSHHHILSFVAVEFGGMQTDKTVCKRHKLKILFHKTAAYFKWVTNTHLLKQPSLVDGQEIPLEPNGHSGS